MKVSKTTILSLVLCIVSLVCYHGYSFYHSRIKDQTYPVIEMEEKELEISIEDGEDILLKGITAYDKKDGDVTESIVIESISRFVNGKRIVTYAAFDKDNHVSKAEREISYKDYESPKFSSKEGYRFPLNAKSIMDGMKAEDCIDGDLTKYIKAAPGYYVSVGAVGCYEFQYQVVNLAGDVEYLPVTVEIYDPADPDVIDFELKEYVVYTKKGEKIDAWSYLDVEDPAGFQIDDSEVNYDEEGTYEITYSIEIGERKGTNRLAVVVR